MKAEKYMWKILIDSTKRREAVVSLVKIENNIETVVSSKTGDLDLVHAMSNILLENNLKLADISEISPNLGPGSFTGIRNGIAISNILNWALGKKGISNLDIPHYGAEPNISERKEKSLN